MSASPQFIVILRGHAVKFSAAPRFVYSIVPTNEATRFTSEASAGQTALSFGLRAGSFEIRAV